MAVVHRGRVYVKVPDDAIVPEFQPGDEIVAVVTVAADGSFTLVKAENESSGGDDDGVLANGTIDALRATEITVGTDGGPVTCAVPRAPT